MKYDLRRLGTRHAATTKMTVTLPDADIELLAEMAADQAATMTAALARSIRTTSFLEKARKRGATVILQEADGRQARVVFT
ncbi:hypothetical protein FNU77_08650 [Prescottella equi]|uniref:hypothetical protein n=1 Tax=Rhodococcus hoagii TaxID=43767 RepID=UPI00116347FD|nr:hypothetical protein [Prescottella equi]QDP09778.1 hypothetical protein FNU77_08650 [Prescottella equi]